MRYLNEVELAASHRSRSPGALRPQRTVDTIIPTVPRPKPLISAVPTLHGVADARRKGKHDADSSAGSSPPLSSRSEKLQRTLKAINLNGKSAVAFTFDLQPLPSPSTFMSLNYGGSLAFNYSIWHVLLFYVGMPTCVMRACAKCGLNASHMQAYRHKEQNMPAIFLQKPDRFIAISDSANTFKIVVFCFILFLSM